MPRVDNNYTIPPGTDGVPDTTIASAKYNTFIHDVELDLNTPRPIVSGGTGATNATQARANLQAERAAQVVTNYDMHVWEIGSFYAASTAMGAIPVADHAFAGIVYGVIDAATPANSKLVVVARDLDDDDTPGAVWVREKIGADPWSAWTQEGATALDAKLDIDGDTMTGDLTISKDTPSFALDRTDDTPAFIFGTKDGLARWAVVLGNGEVETGVDNVGSDFDITAFDDAGVVLGNALTFDRATMLGLVKADPVDDLGIATKQYADSRVYTPPEEPLTPPQQVISRQTIYASPFDALAFNGMQVNGSMDVFQEWANDTPLPSVNGYHMADMWTPTSSGITSLVCTGANVTDAPPGFTYSSKLAVTTAQSSLSSNSFAFIGHAIEGYRVARLNWGTADAQPMTVGFWVKAHRIGDYTLAVRNGLGPPDRSYVTLFEVEVSDTWEWKTITIPGDTTVSATAWNKYTGKGMELMFTMAAGAGYQNTPDAWSTSQAFGATGMINGVADTADTFQITGVIVLPGLEAPLAARSPFIMRPASTELVVCRRYYWRRIYYANQYVANLQMVGATLVTGSMGTFEPMRGSPSITVAGVGNFNAQYSGGGGAAFSAMSFGSVFDNYWLINGTVGVGYVGGDCCVMYANSLGQIAASARM